MRIPFFLKLSALLLLGLFCCAPPVSAQSSKFEHLYPFSCDGKWGVMGANRSIVFEPQCEEIRLFDSDRNNEGDRYSQFAVAKTNGKFGLLNEKLQWAVAAEHDSIELLFKRDYVSSSYFKIKKDGQWGILVWRLGVPTIPFRLKPQFESVAVPYYNCAVLVVKKQGKFGAFNLKDSRQLLPAEYDEVSVGYFFREHMSDGPWIKTRKDGVIACFNQDGTPKPGKPLTEKEMQYYRDLETGVYDSPVREQVSYPSRAIKLGEKKWRVEIFQSNKPQNVLLSTELDGPDEIIRATGLGWPPKTFGHIVAKKDGKIGVVSQKGEAITDYEFDAFSEKRLVERNGLYGLLNSNFDLVLPTVFSKIEEVSKGLYRVEHNDGCIGYYPSDNQYLPPAINLNYPTRSVPYPLAESDKIETLVVPEGSSSFPGGRDSLTAFFETNATIPLEIYRLNHFGEPTIQFIVEKDGSLSSPEIFRASNDQKAEMLRLFALMPRPWKPAISNGQIVREYKYISIKFQ